MPNQELATKRIAVRPDTLQRVRRLAGSDRPYENGWMTHDTLLNRALDIYEGLLPPKRDTHGA